MPLDPSAFARAQGRHLPSPQGRLAITPAPIGPVRALRLNASGLLALATLAPLATLPMGGDELEMQLSDHGYLRADPA